jgi:phosphonate transport system substrate-binding protein
MNKWFLGLLFLALSLDVHSADKKSFKFGISPLKDPQVVRDEWKPLKKLLEKDCGCLINFEVAKSREEFELKLSKTQYDIAFVNPFQQNIAYENGFISLAKEKNRSLQGIIIVREDSKIKKIQDLENQKLAFSKYHPFESSAMVKKKLEAEKVNYEEIQSINLDFVVQNVIMGIAAGGAINMATFSNQDSEDKKFIRILDKTEKIDSEPFVVKKQLAKKTKQSFNKTLINLSINEEGKAILKKLKLKKLI